MNVCHLPEFLIYVCRDCHKKFHGGINMIYIKCLLTGFVTGAVFGFFKLPIPAPMVLEGVVGIFGIFLGYRLVKLL